MIESKFLGKKVAYPTSYAPEVLLAVPRSENREKYGIYPSSEIFKGFDAWHVYEVSCLTNNGLPVCGVIKIVIPCNSPYLVESKSLKLYFASFNMYAMGNSPEEAIDNLCETVRSDINQVLQTNVHVHLYTTSPCNNPIFDFDAYQLLETMSEAKKTVFNTYSETPALLLEHLQFKGEICVGSHLLKSNCKITGQPDWGSIFIHLKADHLPAFTDLLRYIVSFRNENHFHEEICEMVYKRLYDTFQPEILMVSCLYTRRGGIDICPARANEAQYLPINLNSSDILTKQTFRQ